MAEDMTLEKISTIEKSCFAEASPYSLFRDCWIHFVKEGGQSVVLNEMNDQSKLLFFQLRLHGANTCDEINETTTHILALSSDIIDSSLSHLNQNGRIHVVTRQWALDCIKEKKLLKQEDIGIPEEKESSDDSPLFSF